MKSIGIVTNHNSSLATSMRENLDQVFSGYVKYNNHYLREMDKGSQLTDDCILLMTESTAVKLHGNVADKKRLIVVERTVKESELYKIAAIPENTTVLVVNDQYATTLETVAPALPTGAESPATDPFRGRKRIHKLFASHYSRRKAPGPGIYRNRYRCRQ